VQFSELQTRDLDLGSGHTAYRRASDIDLCLHKFHWNPRSFLWTYRCTYYLLTDISDPPNVIRSTLGRLGGDDLTRIMVWLPTLRSPLLL